MPKEIKTKKEWDEKLKDAGNKDKLVAVDFTASWCGPCKMIGPKFVAMEAEFPDVVFLKVDVDENEEVAAAEGISAMPTFKFYKNGKKVDDFCGADEAQLRSMIMKHK